MQSVSSRIWTCVAVSISCDDNHYTTGTSTIVKFIHCWKCKFVCAIVHGNSMSRGSWTGAAMWSGICRRSESQMCYVSEAGWLMSQLLNWQLTWVLVLLALRSCHLLINWSFALSCICCIWPAVAFVASGQLPEASVASAWLLIQANVYLIDTNHCYSMTMKFKSHFIFFTVF